MGRNASRGQESPPASGRSIDLDGLLAGEATPATPDWRSQVRERLEKYRTQRSPSSTQPHAQKVPPDEEISAKNKLVPSDEAPERAVDLVPSEAEWPPSEELGRETFDFEAGNPEDTAPRKVVAFRGAASNRALLDKPLIRKPVRSRQMPRPPVEPKQRNLTFEEMPQPAIELPGAVAPQGQRPEFEIPRDVLFSRFLSGIIDLSLAAATGFFFAFLASLFLQTDFAPLTWLLLAGVCALTFFLLNSVFFLFTTGQTPGMLWTDLRLISKRDPKLSLRSVCLRTLLFLPVVATGLGLIWAIFDPLCRCWHDHLSGTLVIPVPRPPTSS